MRRSVVFPAVLVVGLASLLLARAVPGIAMETLKCLAPGCGKNMKKGTNGCCEPPPCEFLHELASAQAVARVVDQIDILAGLGEPDAYQDIRRFNSDLRSAVADESKKFATCPPNHKYSKPRPFWVDSTCTIGVIDQNGKFQERSLEDEQLSSKACPELVKGEYEEARVQQLFCTPVSRQAEGQSAEEYRATVSYAADAKVRALEQSIKEYWNACSSFADPATILAAAKTGIDELKEPPPKPKPKKKAKRAMGPGRGGR